MNHPMRERRTGFGAEANRMIRCVIDVPMIKSKQRIDVCLCPRAIMGAWEWMMQQLLLCSFVFALSIILRRHEVWCGVHYYPRIFLQLPICPSTSYSNPHFKPRCLKTERKMAPTVCWREVNGQLSNGGLSFTKHAFPRQIKFYLYTLYKVIFLNFNT